MADSIPANAPKAPQVRKQVMDAEGNWVPAPDLPQTQITSEEPATVPYEVGDLVTITGRVVEVQYPQGGQSSIKVQLDNGAGAAWFRGAHLAPKIAPVEEPVDAIADDTPAETEQSVEAPGKSGDAAPLAEKSEETAAVAA